MSKKIRTESVSRSMRQLHADLLLIHRHIEIYWQPHFWDEFELISTNAHSFNVMPHEAEYIETRILEAVESVRTALDSLYQAA